MNPRFCRALPWSFVKRFSWALLAGLNITLSQFAAQLPSTHPSIDLSGEWEFKMDPLDVGRAQKWFEQTIPFDRKIQVPGAWNAQGVAYESEPMLREYET